MIYFIAVFKHILKLSFLYSIAVLFIIVLSHVMIIPKGGI